MHAVPPSWLSTMYPAVVHVCCTHAVMDKSAPRAGRGSVYGTGPVMDVVPTIVTGDGVGVGVGGVTHASNDKAYGFVPAYIASAVSSAGSDSKYGSRVVGSYEDGEEGLAAVLMAVLMGEPIDVAMVAIVAAMAVAIEAVGMAGKPATVVVMVVMVVMVEVLLVPAVVVMVEAVLPVVVMVDEAAVVVMVEVVAVVVMVDEAAVVVIVEVVPVVVVMVDEPLVVDMLEPDPEGLRPPHALIALFNRVMQSASYTHRDSSTAHVAGSKHIK